MANDYIRKADVLNLPQNIERNLKGEIVERSIDVGAIEALPSADVVKVVHGKWIDEDPAFAEYFANCSVCGYEIDVHNERGYFNFCPNCGAKMDGERKE
jgi:hypothetical protein